MLASLFVVTALTMRPAQQTVVILTYHDIVRERTADSLWFDCSKRELEHQLTTMERAGVHFVSVDQLYRHFVDHVPLPSRPVCVTFADSYAGYYRYGLPILRRHHVPTCQFVHTGYVGSPIGRPKLTWDQLVELDRAGDVTIASQTVSHPADMRRLSDAEIRRELRDSKRVLQEHLGHPIYYLAYPNGKFDRRAERAARAAGYRLAFSEVTQPANLSHNHYSVNRYVHTKWQTALRALER